MKAVCANLINRPDTAPPVPCLPNPRTQRTFGRRVALPRFTFHAVSAMLALLVLGVLSATAQPRLASLLNSKWPDYARGYANDVKVVGQYAYVAVGEGGLAVFDVSDPANPVRVGGYDTSGLAYGVAVAGNYAYVADLSLISFGCDLTFICSLVRHPKAKFLGSYLINTA